MATTDTTGFNNLSKSTEFYKREALRLLDDIRRELECTTEFPEPSLNYLSTIHFEVAEKLQSIAGKVTVANRAERKWVVSPLNPANKGK